MRLMIALLATLALTLSLTGAVAAFGITLAADTSVCGRLTLTASGLSANTSYQLVADGGYPDVVKAVTSNGSGVAAATFLRSEFSSDSSANFGNGWVRTQYGGYIAVNVDGGGVAHPPAYHFC